MSVDLHSLPVFNFISKMSFSFCHYSLITQKKALYESKKMSKLIYLLLFLVVIGVLYFLNKKYNTLYVHHNYLSYKNKKIGINNSEYKILKVLHNETIITTNNIHHILSNKELHPNHIYRLIPEVMRDLNKTLVLLLANNNLVFSVSKNKLDRRIREYTFNLNIRMVFPLATEKRKKKKYVISEKNSQFIPKDNFGKLEDGRF
ncbi:hypothetical protein OAD50_02805 [Vicingaceae bacterium]|nr:hypothetical protein [Vicingaceae bacterium]